MDDVTVKQALKIEKYMGCSFAEWGKRLQGSDDPKHPREPDMRARQVLGWLILHPDGGVPIEDTDFKMGKFGIALDEAWRAEAAGEDGEPVPTVVASNGHSPGSSLVISQPSSDGI